MSLSVRGVALTAAIVWGGCMFVTGLINLAFPSYGVAWLHLAASIYPGYQGPGGLGSVLVVGVYGVIDGAAGGAIIGWLYNRAVARGVH